MRMIVTGNEQEREFVGQDENEVVYYDSWEDVQEENPEVMIPGYIPDGLRLEEISRWEIENHFLYKAIYSDNSSNNLLKVQTEYFENNYATLECVNEDEWQLLKSDEENRLYYYQKESDYLGIWIKNKCIYIIEMNDYEEVCNIIRQLE